VAVDATVVGNKEQEVRWVATRRRRQSEQLPMRHRQRRKHIQQHEPACSLDNIVPWRRPDEEEEDEDTTAATILRDVPPKQKPPMPQAEVLHHHGLGDLPPCLNCL
jgi:hypothetical protein